MSAFNYRKKQQQRRSVVGRSIGGGGKGMKGETRIVFALNPAAAAQLTRLYRIIKPRDRVKAQEEGEGKGRGTGPVHFMQKYAEFSPKWPTSTSGRPRRRRHVDLTVENCTRVFQDRRRARICATIRPTFNFPRHSTCVARISPLVYSRLRCKRRLKKKKIGDSHSLSPQVGILTIIAS